MKVILKKLDIIIIRLKYSLILTISIQYTYTTYYSYLIKTKIFLWDIDKYWQKKKIFREQSTLSKMGKLIQRA